MNIIIFITSAGILLSLLILHSYVTKGARITFNFFLFAFMVMFNKEVVGTAQYNIPKHYLFLTKNSPAIIGQLTIVIGWMITFYLSWRFSELVLSRFYNFKKKLFATLAFSIIVTMSISFCLENFAEGMDLWHWSYYSPSLKPFLINCVIEALRGWMHMSFMFLLPFLLIECSKYRLANWKGIFFFIPLAYLWTAPFIGIRNFVMIIEVAIINIICFSFFSRLEIECDTVRQVNPCLKSLKYINQIPFIVLGLMLSFVIVGEVFFLKQAFLLITTVPLLVILLLSIKKIPLFLISILSLVIFIIFKEKAVVALIPIIFALLFWAIDKVKSSFSQNIRPEGFLLKRASFLIGIIISSYLSYQIIIFLYLGKMPRPPRVIMSVYKGPTVTLSGSIIFKEYKKGFISLEVLAKEPKKYSIATGQFIIASEMIYKPGFYKIKIPKKIGKVYIIARNLDIEDISKMPTPGSVPIGRGEYVKNPLQVVSQDINGVDIEIKPL